MTLKKNGRLSRREILHALSLCAAGSTTLAPFLSGCRGALETPESLERIGGRRDALDGKPKFLVVISAAGGASIIDSLLAVRASESSNAAGLNTFPDASVQSVPNAQKSVSDWSPPSSQKSSAMLPGQLSLQPPGPTGSPVPGSPPTSVATPTPACSLSMSSTPGHYSITA